MERTIGFRRQHDAMIAIVAEMRAEMKKKHHADTARTLNLHMMRLTGKLKVHLAQEDQLLYPRAMESQNAAAAETAKHFQRDMGHISEAYMAFHNKWQSLSGMQADLASFVSEAGAILDALEDRIQRENNELYPLIDKM